MSDQTSERAKRPISALAWSIKIFVALGVTVLALWWATDDVPLGEVQDRLLDTKWSAVAIYVATQFLIHGIRTVRWGLLVRPLADVSKRSVFAAASVGIPSAMFLPLRLGEFVRPVMISRAGVPFTSGLASVIVERVADGLTNVALFFCLLMFLPVNAAVPEEIRLGAKLALIIFGGACAVLLVIGIAREKALKLIENLLSPVSKPLAEKILGLLSGFLTGLQPLAQPGRAFIFLVLTAAYWGLNGLVTWILIQSYGIDLPWLAGPFTVSVLVFAVMVPAGPAFIGPMQAGFKAGLAAYAIGATDALVVGISAHVATVACFSVILATGLLASESKKTRSFEPKPE